MLSSDFGQSQLLFFYIMERLAETREDLPSIAEILRLNRGRSDRWSGSYYSEDKRPLSPEFFDSVHVSRLYQSQSRNASTVLFDEKPLPLRRCSLFQRFDAIRTKAMSWFRQVKCSVLRKLQSERTSKDGSLPSAVIKVVQQPESDIGHLPPSSRSQMPVPCVRFSIPPPPPPKSSMRTASSITVARARDAYVEKGRYIMSKSARNPAYAVQESNSQPGSTTPGNGHEYQTHTPLTSVHIARRLKPPPETTMEIKH